MKRSRFQSGPGLSLLLGLLGAALPALCSPMAAWYANDGVQFVMQDTDDYLYYSYCNTGFDVAFPTDQSLKLPVLAKPRANTAITGVGWYDEQGKKLGYAAFVWYFDSFDDLVYKRYRCDTEKGEFKSEDYQILTDEIPSDVKLNQESGLAAVLLGATDGIRLYFHDAQDTIHSLMFSNDRRWGYEQLINPDLAISGKAIGAVNRNTKGNEITLITPKDSSNMEECRLDRDGLWYIDTFPNKLAEYNVTNKDFEQEYQVSTFGAPAVNGTVLEEWDGQPGNIGVALGEDYRSMFYIGTDKALHKLSSFPTINNTKDTEDEYINKGQWHVEPSQNEKYWPLADEANAHFAMAGWLDDNGAHVHIYYMSNGTLTRALFGNKTWYDAETVPTVPPPPADEGGDSGGHHGLSDGAKAGIGVGAFVSAFALAFLASACYMMRRRRRVTKEQQDREAAGTLFAGGQAPMYQQHDGYNRPCSPYENQHIHHQQQQHHGGHDVPSEQQQHGVFAVYGQPFHYVPSVSTRVESEYKSEPTVYRSELPDHRTVDSYEMLGEGHFREMDTPVTTHNTLNSSSGQYHGPPLTEPSPNSDVGEISRVR